MSEWAPTSLPACAGGNVGSMKRNAGQPAGSIPRSPRPSSWRAAHRASCRDPARDCIGREARRQDHERAAATSNRFINREYKRRWQEAQAAGRPFMPYAAAAKARLRKALVGVAAGDQPALVTRVFGAEDGRSDLWSRRTGVS